MNLFFIRIMYIRFYFFFIFIIRKRFFFTYSNTPPFCAKLCIENSVIDTTESIQTRTNYHHMNFVTLLFTLRLCSVLLIFSFNSRYYNIFIFYSLFNFSSNNFSLSILYTPIPSLIVFVVVPSHVIILISLFLSVFLTALLYSLDACLHSNKAP